MSGPSVLAIASSDRAHYLLTGDFSNRGDDMKNRQDIIKLARRIAGPVILVTSIASSAQASVQESNYREMIERIRRTEAAPERLRPLAPTQAPFTSEIESLTLDPGCAASDNWCGGTMVLGGVSVRLPRNLLIDLPANRLSLKQIFQQAQSACVGAGQSGLARADTCRITTKGAYATVNANNDSCGNTIAGDVFIANGPELITGRVTFINFTDGYFRINGVSGSDVGGTMTRLNDPSGVSTIQQGQGCAAGSQNCSPDVRFMDDSTNYTFAFKNGYPACIPSTVVKPGHATPANALGAGDPLCPDSNRTAAVPPNFFVQDSRRFAPIRVGDTVAALGGFVTVGGVRFLSAHTVNVMLGLSTREAADQPDYMVLERAVWGVANFPERKVVGVFVGFTTLPDSQLDIFALRVDPRDNESYQDPLTSTVGNPRTTNKILTGPGGKFQIVLDVHFPRGAPVPRSTSPCFHLRNAAFDVCENGGTLAEEFSILVPPTREIQAVTRRTIPLNPGVVTLDILGREASNGQWTQPLGASIGGLVPAEPGEADMGTGFGPLILEALPWTIDRRTSPGGCIGACESSPQALLPYPASRVDLRATSVANEAPAAAIDRVLTYFTFSSGSLVPHVFASTPPDSCLLPLRFRNY